MTSRNIAIIAVVAAIITAIVGWLIWGGNADDKAGANRTSAGAPAPAAPATTLAPAALAPQASAPLGSGARDSAVRRDYRSRRAGVMKPTASEPASPSFDIVRVNPRGDTVVTGRAEPNTEVVLRDGGTEIGRARADERGEWVILPEKAGSTAATANSTWKRPCRAAPR